MRVLFDTLGHLFLRGQFPFFSIIFHIFPYFSIFFHCFPLFSIFFHCFRLRPSRFPLLRPWQIDAWGTCGAKYRRPRRKISAPAAQQTSVPAAQKNIGAYGALNKRHRRNNSVPAAQNNIRKTQRLRCKKGACGATKTAPTARKTWHMRCW